MAGAELAGAEDRAAERGEHRLDAVDGGAGAADHDGERAVRRAPHAAGDRRVDEAAAGGDEGLAERLRCTALRVTVVTRAAMR